MLFPDQPLEFGDLVLFFNCLLLSRLNYTLENHCRCLHETITQLQCQAVLCTAFLTLKRVSLCSWCPPKLCFPSLSSYPVFSLWIVFLFGIFSSHLPIDFDFSAAIFSSLQFSLLAWICMPTIWSQLPTGHPCMINPCFPTDHNSCLRSLFPSSL